MQIVVGYKETDLIRNLHQYNRWSW